MLVAKSLIMQSIRSPAYETAVDPWSNTIAMEIPSTYSISLVLREHSLTMAGGGLPNRAKFQPYIG